MNGNHATIPGRFRRSTGQQKLLLRLGSLEEALHREKEGTVQAGTPGDCCLKLLEHFPALIWRADTTAQCDYFNQTWLAFTGRTLEQELGVGWAEGVHPHDLRRCHDTYLEAFERREPFVMEYLLRRHDGEYRTIRDHGAPLFLPDGAFAGYLGSCYDIHDQKMLEERLRHSQKMEAIGILAGGVAHDFNNILSIILGYGGMLLLQTPPETPAHEQLAAMVDAAVRASKLTSKLLTFSRHQETAPERVCLCDQVESFATFLHQLAGKQTVTRLDLRDAPQMVRLGRGVVEQVLINLVLNARDAMPDGGQLHISVHQAELAAPEVDSLDIPPGTYACLAVSDTGIGIPAELLAKVFDPFFTTKEVGKGSGLGLSMVYGIVRHHNGSVTIASQPTGGTTVTIYLPHADFRTANASHH